nr:hypothetical protein HAGR004_41720 [Bdellovibrio sp. HAGR004]
MRTLLVEDDDDLREIFKEQLIGLGCSVIEVKNGEQALLSLKTVEIDLVISDIQMPVLDGVSFLKKAREEFKTLPIFIITGSSPYTEREILSYGASGYFEKSNFDLKTIIDQVSPKVA